MASPAGQEPVFREHVFEEPWQAQAFALANALIDKGIFSADEWANTLGAEIKRAQAAGDPDTGETYYNHWLAALERLCADRGLAPGSEVDRRAAEWRAAYLATPHGKAVELKSGEKKGTSSLS